MMENKTGIKKTLINQLEDLKNEAIDRDFFANEKIIDTICEITEKIGKEIAVFINRKGEVLDVEIGDENTVTLKDLADRRSENSLSGIRVLHTHPNGSGMLSDVDLSALKKLRFDMMAAVGVKDGAASDLFVSFLGMDDKSDLLPLVAGPYPKERFMKLNVKAVIIEAEENLKKAAKISKAVEVGEERAVLVGIENEEALEELRELLKTAGGKELSRMIQTRDKKDNAYFIGKGKLKELSLLVQTVDANLVVFDEELSGAQIRNLEEVLGIKVIDRTQLILDIFAQRAKSREGKLQVELAQLKYAMPRLIGLGGQLSRTGGGIGTRGPGEKKLEIDRRRIRDRVNDLQNEIKEIKKQRSVQRVSREANNVFQACLVGYTNAGKSTLLNSLADADIYAMDQLFATLDPTTRKVTLESGKEILITDTVGFIKKLPHDLVEAFKSTLEEVLYADLLIHVVDGSNKDYDQQIKVVLEVLKELGAENKAMITAINKMDKVEDFTEINVKSTEEAPVVYLSALNKSGFDNLMLEIDKFAAQKWKIVELMVPYTDGAMNSMVHNNCRVIAEDYREEGVYVKAEIDPITYGRLAKYVIP
ncbi:MAG: GTPase HflX [Clostridiales bacterium GWB2_37_7]|nr:MAG: GTPase HflX [Clostridiales bacterium GWB2_37_7]